MSIEFQKFTPDELSTEKLDDLIKNKASFQVVSVSNIGAMVERVEERIEKAALRCRIYTEYRTATLGALFTPAALWGLGAAVGMAAHNLATLNPDYEIGKNKVKSMVTVTYKK